MADATPLTAADLDVRELRAETAKWRQLKLQAEKKLGKAQEEIATLTKSRDDAIARVQTLGTEHVTALAAKDTEIAEIKKAAVADPDSLQAKIVELTGKIRDREHRDVFNKKATDLGVQDNVVALSDLWEATKYKAESDTPDPEALSGLIATALEARPWLKAKAAETAQGRDGETVVSAPGAQRPSVTLPAKPAGPGATRGNSETTPQPTSVGAKVDEAFAKSGRDIGKGFRL